MMRLALVCAVAAVVTVVGSFLLSIPLALGAGLFLGAVAGEVVRARQGHRSIHWVRAGLEGLLTGVPGCLALWILMR